MAKEDPYATPALYRRLIEKTDTSEDAEITDDLKAVSRLIDHITGWHFSTYADTRYFDGNGQRRLYLPPPSGIAIALGFLVAVDLDGSYNYATSLAHFVDFRLGPLTGFVQVQYGDVVPGYQLTVIDTGKISIWPEGQRTIKITATWGWLVGAPEGIRRYTAELTAILRLESPRATDRTPGGLDQAFQMSAEATAIIGRLVSEYRHPMFGATF